ncbi:MAG: hypothetical protein IJ168_02035 [Eubacterium sp.]|nr:hypothetical protein [Eubacterium sp.]
MIFKLFLCGFLCFGFGVFLTATISSIKVTHYHDAAVKWKRLYNQLQEAQDDGNKQLTEE